MNLLWALRTVLLSTRVCLPLPVGLLAGHAIIFLPKYHTFIPMLLSSIVAPTRPGRAGRGLLLLLLLLGFAPATHAANYYWVGGTGLWNDLDHWASSSGGSATHDQVPQSTDNVYFDANSFTASNQTITIDATVTCFDMDWTGAVHAVGRGGTTGGARLVGSGTVEVNGDLRLATGLGQQDANVSLLATSTGHVLDLQAVPINGWLSFDSKLGGWLFTSDANLVQYGATPSLLLNTGSIDFGSAQVSCYGVRSTGNLYRTILLNNSTFNLLSPVNTWELSGTNLIFDAGASILRLGTTVRATANGYSFISTEQVYNVVEVAAGTTATFSVAGSAFTKLLINGNTTLTSAAAIGGTLAVGRDVVLRAAAGQALSFAGTAQVVSGGSCAGLASLQSSVPGKAAVFNRTGGWGSTALTYAAVQDVVFSGSGVPLPATACLDRGNTQGAAFSTLAVSDLYWVGGTGAWHDASHWASVSGGSASGNSCLPSLATNVHFDANSFTASGQVVTLDGANAFCRDLDWTDANAPVFSRDAANPGLQQLGIGGSLTLNTTMTLALATDLVFYGYEAGAPNPTVLMAKQVLTANLYFRAPGSTYTLLDALTLAPGITSPNGRIYVEAGTLDTNSQDVAAQGFTSGYAATSSVFSTGTAGGGPVSAAPVVVNLGNSTLTLTPASALGDVGTRATYTWDVAAGAVLNAGTSTIRIGTNATNNQPAYFVAGLGQQYHTVAFTDPAALSLPWLVSGGGAPATFDELIFAGSADINSSNVFTQQLVLAPGHAYTFNSTTQTFARNAQLNAVGGCGGFLSISGTSATAGATFSKPAGGILPNMVLQFTALRDVAFTGGSTWTASQSLNNGGTTGLVFTSPPVARTLYWVGGTGPWSAQSHWALSSGGAGGNCAPNQLDDALFDGQSFTAPNQVVTLDAVQAACRSLNWAAATNTPTFSGISTNKLSVHGSLTWSPAMSQQLLGETLILGAATITSAGQAFGGALTINAPGATVGLADALQQPRTAGAGLTLLAGTFLTNNQPVRLRNLLSNPLPGTAPAARALRLGSSTVEITAGNWTITQPASLTFDAGTSTIFLSTGTFFNGNGFTYNTVQLGPGILHVMGGNSTIATLLLAGVNLLTGSNTITSQLTLEPGSTFRFGAGTTTTFAAAANVQASGTGTRVITLQSTINGQAFIWSKPASATPAGTVCASFIYLRDSQAQGGAYFETGQQANNQGNTSGWSFATLPQAISRSQQVCPQLGAHTLRFTFTGLDRLTQQPTVLAAAQFPLTVVLRNLTAGTNQTISVPYATYDLPMPNSTATTNYQVISVATNSASCSSLINTGTFPVVTDGPLNGPAGQWTGAGTGPDWLDCQNWASGTVPTATTNVTVAASPLMPVLNSPGAAVATLRVLPGGQLTLGSAAELAITGDWLNTGTTTLDPASQVSFVGSSAQALAGSAFGRAVVNNPAGLVLQTDAGTATSLTLTAGLITTGSYKWLHTNSAATSLTTSGSGSYVVGNLRRSIADGVSATYAFPVGTAGQYARLDLLSSQLAGTSFLDARFSLKTDSDAGLSCTETTPSALRYLAVYPAGIWTLTPDAQPASGTYALQASLMPFANLVDNEFGLLRRPDTSLSATDWSAGGGSLSPGNGAGRLVADGYTLRSSLRTFGQFGLGQAKSFAPLPVTLVSFQAVARGQAALLTWTTAQEVNNEHFDVEFSTDSQAFKTMKRVPGHGSSTVAHTYSFTDEQLANYGAKLVYYRLRQADANGSSQFSAVRTVAVSGTTEAFAVYPSLLAPGEPLHYALGEAVAAQATGAGLLIYTLTGQCLATHVLAAGATGSIDTARLLHGWYLARLRLANGRFLTASFGVQ
ncbi:beta strand repeat-containing protein [Hymenobacter siberiensis]|uniref:beta strand repeat-containing protein n=1 Tax=Hymenobacter siberiensis TaxID=2848396 RepID=UPI001C1E7696|nr:hypothetical protein [Hymenobacter siberiensis]MBU6121973.1 hypothetical protein [Hymenobacter siberiensis]